MKQVFRWAFRLLTIMPACWPALAQEGGAVALPALAARYDLVVGPRRAEWYLIRDPERIATFNAGSRQGEIWERAPSGAIAYRRLFLDDRKIVEYTPGELRARGSAPRWVRLASLLDPGQVASLRQTGERSVLGRRALVLAGELDGAATLVWWLADAQLPALVERRGEQEFRLELTELLPVTATAALSSAWPRLDEASFAGFELIDAADLGDREADPFVQKLLAQDGRSQAGHFGQGHAHPD